MPVTINGSAGVTTNSGAVYDSIQRGTSITLTNQTAPEFTGIPSWVKRITLMLNGVSTNGTSSILVQIGSTTYQTSGYTGAGSATANATTSGVANSTSGFLIFTNTAASIMQVSMRIENITGNSWVSSHAGGKSDAAVVMHGGGAVTLSGTLDRVRLFIDGTQQFDAGTINILFE
jgi:hypothetical protein